MILVWSLMLFALAQAKGGNEDRLNLSAEPNPIEGGLTKNLLLNCSFEGRSKDRIVSMSISKQNGPGGFQDGGELAGITTFGNQVSKAECLTEARVSGDVRKTSSGYLSIALQNVSKYTQGVYVCRAIIFEDSTGTSDLTSRVKVGYKAPQIPGLLKRLDILEANVLGKIQGLERRQSWLKWYIIKDKYFVSRPWNGRRYFLSYDHVVNARASNKACGALGGYLVEIDTGNEYHFVKQFILTYPFPIEGVLLGGTDEGREGHWRNIHSGRPMGYIRWAKGQPNNSGGDQHCSEYHFPLGDMNDLPCTTTYTNRRYLCEVPLSTIGFN